MCVCVYVTRFYRKYLQKETFIFIKEKQFLYLTIIASNYGISNSFIQELLEIMSLTKKSYKLIKDKKRIQCFS